MTRTQVWSRSDRKVPPCARFLCWDRPSVGYPFCVAVVCETDEPRPTETEALHIATTQLRAMGMTHYSAKPDHTL